MEQKRLKVSPEMVGRDAGMVCPRRERAKVGAEHHAREGEDGRDKGAGPASAEVSELGDRLGKKDLVGVALEVAQDRGAEDGRDDDDAEKPGEASLRMLAKGPLRRTLPFPLPTGPKLSDATQRKENASHSRKYM